jgi:ribosomal protein L36
MATAPHAGASHAGMTGAQLRVACARPSDPLPVFGDALRELKERANFLYEDGGRYWFATQPTLNRIADERAKLLPARTVDESIVAELREDARSRGGFSRVHAAPDEPTDVEDGRDLALVVLGPATPHSGRAAGPSPATEVASSVLKRCRSSQRIRRNTLIFVAAEEVELSKPRENIRQLIAGKRSLTTRR